MNVLADTAVVYVLVSTSMIAYNSSCSSKEHKLCLCFIKLGESRELRRLTIGKLLELELSLSDYLSLPSRKNDECIG